MDGPFRGTEAVALGLVSRNHLRGPRFRRMFPDVYLPADGPLDLVTRSRAAYLLVRDRGGVLAGYSAATLLGADCAPAAAPAEVLLARAYRARAGLVIRNDSVTDADVTEVQRCRVTTPLRTAWDLARRLPLTEAVVAVDALAHGRTFEPSELLARRAREPGARHCRRLDRVVALANPKAESPMETRLRLNLLAAGLPAPEVQYEILDEFGFVLARADLAYPAAKLDLEYDGALHYSRARTEQDKKRDARLADHGWLTLRLGRDDIGAADLIRRVTDQLRMRTRPAPS